MMRSSGVQIVLPICLVAPRILSADLQRGQVFANLLSLTACSDKFAFQWRPNLGFRPNKKLHSMSSKRGWIDSGVNFPSQINNRTWKLLDGPNIDESIHNQRHLPTTPQTTHQTNTVKSYTRRILNVPLGQLCT